MPPPFSVPALAALQSHWRGRASFTLLDLDFNDGRRFMAVAEALLGDETGPHCLHYVVCAERWDMEAQPVHAGVADSAFGRFAAQLKSAWLPAVPGFQRLILADGRLVLTFAAGTPAFNLPRLDMAFDAACCRPADADGNALRWLGRLAAGNALLVIDGAAADSRPLGVMNADLTRAGFADMPHVSAGDGGAADRVLRLSRRISSRSVPRYRAFSLPSHAEKHALVIGAGLAGAAACHRLAARGWRCTLIERHAAPAREASGNAAGIFMPVLSRDDNPLSRLSRAAFLFALHLWEGLGGVGAALQGQRCGVLQLPRSDAAATEEKNAAWTWPADFARRLGDAEAAAALGQRAGAGWWFEKAGWLRPAAVCEAMLDACGERLRILYGSEAAHLRHIDGVWNVMNAAGSLIAQAPVVILANGVQAMQFAQTAQLPLQAIRGQVTHLPAWMAGAPFVVCGDAYLTPAHGGVASLGATYDNDADPALREESHRQNIRHLQAMLPDWRPPEDLSALGGRVGFRCASADRLPLVGALPDPAQSEGDADTRLEDMPRLPGLHCLLGYGSRGLIWAPLAAELLAAQLNGEPSPLPRDLSALLDPARFALKQRRGQSHRQR